MLFACGDARNPLPETVRALDEILTEFVQGVAFESARVAQHAGRQKLKLSDFEFAMRRNPTYLGKMRDVFDKQKDIKSASKTIGDNIFREAEGLGDVMVDIGENLRGTGAAKSAATGVAVAASAAAAGGSSGGGGGGGGTKGRGKRAASSVAPTESAAPTERGGKKRKKDKAVDDEAISAMFGDDFSD